MPDRFEDDEGRDGLSILSAEGPSRPVVPGPVTIAAMREAETGKREDFDTVDGFMAHLHADD